jgi:hypothetical protein
METDTVYMCLFGGLTVLCFISQLRANCHTEWLKSLGSQINSLNDRLDLQNKIQEIEKKTRDLISQTIDIQNATIDIQNNTIKSLTSALEKSYVNTIRN